MAWRDWLRRRPVAEPETAPAPGAAASGSATDAAPHSGVPGDWDGGWRMTSPPSLTVSRAPLGVSDGLAFRGGLAAWQDPSFDTGLAHAVLPTAPSGLLRGVARPAAPGPRATAPGGPLLLRAIRPQRVAEGDGLGAAEPASPERALSRRSGTGPAAVTGTGRGTGTGTGSRSRTAGAPVATPGAGRSGRGGGAAPVGPVGPVVARAASREGVNPGNARDSSASPDQAAKKARSESEVRAAGEGGSGAARRAPGSAPAPREGRASGPAVQRSEASGPAVQRSEASGPAVQRSEASGPAPDLTMPVGQDPAVTSPTAGGGSPSHGPAVRHARTAAATGPGEPSRGLVSPQPPTVLGAVQRAEFPSADAARPGPVQAPLPAFPLVRRIAVVPGVPGIPADGPAQAGAWAVSAPTPRVQRATAPSAAPEARAVVRPRGVGRTLTVARVAAVPRRRVTVVPQTATASAPPPVQRARSTEDHAPLGAPAAPEPASVSRPLTEPGRPGTAPAPTVPAMPVLQRKAEAPTDGPTAPSAGPATVPTGTTPGPAPKQPVLRRKADENADNPSMPERPVLQRTTDEPVEAPAASLTEPSVASAPAMPTLQRSTAEPTDTPATPLTRPPAGTTPAMPALPRKAEAPTGGQATADRPVLRRTADGPPVGLGAPMAQLPPTSRTTRPAPARPAEPLAPVPTLRRRTDGPPDSPVTAGGPTATTPAAPGPRPARARTGLGAPLAALPASAAAAMPSVDVQRAAAPATARPSSGSAQSTGNASRPTSARGADARGGEGRPMPLVVARRVDHPDGIARHQAPGSSRTGAHSLRLLADRTLTTGLSADAPGLPTTPAPTRSVPARPVVPARWASASADSPTAPSTASGSPAVQRVAVAPAAAPGFHPTRPAPDARRTTAPLPVTGPQAQGVAPFVVQPAPAGPGPAVPALPGVARPVPTVTSAPAAHPVPTGRTAPAAPGVRPRSAATPSPVATVQRAAKPPATASAGPAPKSGSTPQAAADTDLDDLARKLIDPVARLLRAELRRGRERAGRPFDGRR
ncbi:hypothetical protein ACIRQF_12800 [Streptomyces sp. NPDC101191]|uniref:hypothetical protein n=1 Tax=Streptomyces sp. NPDC101191 TaxID=3366126 RepID=UPI00380AA548